MINFSTKKKEFAELFNYGVFGFLAFLVNMLSFYFFTAIIGWYYLFSNILASNSATSFAFFTNKIIVFKSKGCTGKESIMFLVARIGTLFVDMFLLWLLVNCLMVSDVLAKTIVNIVVIIVNYLISKFWVFSMQ